MKFQSWYRQVLQEKVSLHQRNKAGHVVESSTRPMDTALQENYKNFSWPSPEPSHCEIQQAIGQIYETLLLPKRV